MKAIKSFLKNYKLLLIIYFFLSVFFLTKFPFVHSDESWLSGLSRNYIDKGTPIVTEAFFDIMPRFPHAIKIIFHYMQSIFIGTFGYNIFSVRLLSLVFGLLSLIAFYKLCYKITNSSLFSIIIMSFLAFDIQFIYASHFARQEIIILFFLITSVYIILKDDINIKKDVILGLITGISIGIHPNSFFVAVCIGCIYLYKFIFLKQTKFKNLLTYIFVTAAFAAVFIGISLYFDADFFYNYKNFGNQFGVFYNATSKITQIKDFYLKLYYGVSGTYYTPNIKFQLILFFFTFIIAIFAYIKNKFSKFSIYIGYMLAVIVGINIALIIVGRYNQTSVIFIFPFFYLLLGILLSELNKKYRYLISLIIIIVLIISSIINILPFINNDYNNYISNIESVVSKESKVLANLNSEFYFENNCLYDYRNLNFLQNNDLTFSKYINTREIEYIIYPKEMDFIYNRRPVWNGIYGNLYFYYDDMQKFLKDNCKLIYEFTSPYGMRIVRYTYKQDWNVKIYKVK